MKTKRNIIICDDDKTDIKLFKKYLGADKLKKYEIFESENSYELDNLLNNSSFNIDLIFLDYYLGEQSGLEILKKIRIQNNAPVVMLTGRGDEEIAVECMKEGAIDYIPKDLLPNIDLAKVIDQSIEKWEIERERDLLLGITAHELRNPISVILGYTQILQSFDELEPDKRGEIYDAILDRTEHLLNIINELLDITRIDKGIVSLEKKSINLTQLIDKKVNEYHFLASKKKIKIIFQPPSDVIVTDIDPNRIEEVLSNLLDNAIKYSEQNTTVEVTLAIQNDKIEISIRDEGLGIKESELKYLFSLFSSKKISTLPTGQEPRTGLGLAICKKVIDAHNGEILVKSEVGVGTTFTILLPFINMV